MLVWGGIKDNVFSNVLNTGGQQDMQVDLKFERREIVIQVWANDPEEIIETKEVCLEESAKKKTRET